MNIKLFILIASVVSNLFAVKIIYDYDNLNRLTDAEYETGLTINYGYDPVGNLVGTAFTGAYGNVFYVSPDGSHLWPFLTEETAATNIQDAINFAKDGDAVIVDKGVYHTEKQIVLTNGIMLIGTAGPLNCIIDGEKSHRCIYIDNKNAVVQGFTITNGFVTGETENGGGIFLHKNGKVKSCIIAGNYAEAYAGGIYCFAGGKVIDCEILGNNAYYGGGVFLKYSGTVEKCELYKNSARGNGGGVCFEFGGLVSNSEIYDNSTTYGDGGGVYCFTGGIMRSCLIIGNNAARFGGGIGVALSGLVQNCTISMNSADSGGDGIYCWNGGRVENSIIYFNDEQNYLNFGTNWIYEYSCTIPAIEGEGNISGDPGFECGIPTDKLETWATFFHLQAGSPCINKGKNKIWMNEATDIDGDDRILGERVDIGADERN